MGTQLLAEMGRRHVCNFKPSGLLQERIFSIANPTIVCFFTKPYDYLARSLMDISRFSDLLILLWYVALVYADCICPQRSIYCT